MMLHLSEKTALRISFLAVLSLTATVGRSNPQETGPVDYVDPRGITKPDSLFDKRFCLHEGKPGHCTSPS